MLASLSFTSAAFLISYQVEDVQDSQSECYDDGVAVILDRSSKSADTDSDALLVPNKGAREEVFIKSDRKSVV